MSSCVPGPNVSSPSLEFHVPRRFHSGYSLLGRLVRGRVRDARRAEASFVIVLAMTGLSLLMMQYLGWAVVRNDVLAEPRGPVAMAFFLTQLGSVLFYLLLGFVGFRPGVTAAWSAQGLRLRQGDEVLTLAPEAVLGTSMIPLLTWHRHYRRYAATRSFVSWTWPELLLVHTPGGPVVIGLPPDEATRLHACLSGARVPAPPAPAPAPVA